MGISAVSEEFKNRAVFLKGEADKLYSRSEVVVLAGSGAERALKSGMVLGRRSRSSAVMAAGGGNTGNGVAGAVTLGAEAKVGVYTLRCVAAATNAGTFAVIDPEGFRLDDLTVAAAYASPHFGVTIADGSTDFVVGDTFTLTVTGDGKVVQIDKTATNGGQEAAGILLFDVTAPDGVDAKGVMIERDAIVSDIDLVWPETFDANDKAAAVARLAERGILVREGV